MLGLYGAGDPPKRFQTATTWGDRTLERVNGTAWSVHGPGRRFPGRMQMIVT